jgi:hypothetical protein
VEAIAKEAMDLYPGAKVLYVPSLNKENRQLMQAKIGSGDYDMIVMTHETLGKIRMSPPEEAKFLEREMEEITEALESASASTSNPDKDPTVKQLTKALEKKQVAYEKALNPEAKDDAVYFDELGIDQLFIDEAHKFKTLPVYSRQKVKGIPTGQSQRATAMLNKCQWLLKNNNNRGVVFATGTSITNTVGEAYNMQRFLIPDQLEERGIKNFDQWATLFADVENKPEFNVAGDYVPTQRMVKFTNLPELSRLSRTMMSVKWADDSYQIDDNGKIVLDKDGKPVKTIIRPKKVDNPVVIPRNRRMETYMKNLSKRAQEVKARGRSNEPGQDNMLVICTDGRKAAIDMRLVDSNAPDDPNSKVNQMVRQILDFHKKNPGQTQLVFSNIGVSNILRKDEKDRARANASTDVQADQDDVDSDEKDVTIEGVNLDSNTGFNLYGDIIGKLVAGGIPKEKIADFRNVSPAEKLRLVAGLKSGEILVALGSTQKLGTGVNCQDKVGAMHHLDVPWVPADLEQRDGRGYRHGNKNKEVNVFKYVTEGSLDQKFWDIISKKAKFIGQYLNGSNESRTADEEDTEELAPETLMALASGDPRVMEKANLDLEVPALESEQKRHMRAQEREKAITRDFTVKANKAQSKVDEVKKIVDHFDNHPDFSMEIEGVAYDKPGEAGKAIAELMKKQQDRNEFYTDSYYASREKTLKLGTYRGLPLWTNNRGNYWVDLNNSSYSSADSDTSYSVGMMPYPTGDATGEQTAKFFEQTLTGFPKMANAHAKYFSRELAENSAALKEIQTALEKRKRNVSKN